MLILAAVAAGLVIVLASTLLSRSAQARSRRRLERAIGELDDCLAGVTESLRRALETAPAVRRGATPELSLVLDLDELLARLAREAAARAETDTAAVRVRGAAGEPAIGLFGSEHAAPLLESASRAAGDRPFRALTVSWTYPPQLDSSQGVFRSALVVPVLERGLETGVIAAYSREPMAFRPEHAHALELLAAETADSIAVARRFAGVGTSSPTRETPPPDAVAGRPREPADASRRGAG